MDAGREKEVAMIETYIAKLKKEAKRNDFFRKVLFTGAHSQLVVMCLQPGEEIGTEVHEIDQVIFIVDGEGKVVLDGRGETIEEGMVVCVPARLRHNVINTEDEPMRLFTVYAPPQHPAETIQESKAHTEAAEIRIVETQPV
jgi:mannose-6-phosphate isomerase-like protein (cupin superfamily)